MTELPNDIECLKVLIRQLSAQNEQLLAEIDQLKAEKEGTDSAHVISRRMQFIEIDNQGNALNAGWAPYLNLEPVSQADRFLIEDVLSAPWITQNLEQQALAHASTYLVPEHFDEVRTRREHSVDKTLTAVHERLVKEINYWSDRYIKLQDDIAATPVVVGTHW